MITCKEYVEIKKKELKGTVTTLIAANNRKPKLCVIQIGDDPASNIYVKNKGKDCHEMGILFDHVHIKDYENFSEYDLIQLIEQKDNDATVDGIIVQLPIPDKYNVERIQKYISPEKDVDGFRVDSLFTPCTPKGIMDYMEYNNVEFAGTVCTVIGRSEIVGRPLVNLLIKKGATVINCNSKTPNLKQFTKMSDIVISAIGKANYFDGSYFNVGQILIDIGINQDENGKLCGDIREDIKDYALATSVPRGIGLTTRLALLENTVLSYMKREKMNIMI